MASLRPTGLSGSQLTRHMVGDSPAPGIGHSPAECPLSLLCMLSSVILIPMVIPTLLDR